MESAKVISCHGITAICGVPVTVEFSTLHCLVTVAVNGESGKVDSLKLKAPWQLFSRLYDYAMSREPIDVLINTKSGEQLRKWHLVNWEHESYKGVEPEGLRSGTIDVLMTSEEARWIDANAHFGAE